MCFWIAVRQCAEQMSFWGRKKYTITFPSRRASSYSSSNSNSPISTRRTNDYLQNESRTATTLGRHSILRHSSSIRSEDSRIIEDSRPPEINRRSQSLSNLTLEPPPPLPPRRRPPPPTLNIQNDDMGHLQLPPSSIIPILERNALVRNSRLLTSVSNTPFAFFRFEEGGGSNEIPPPRRSMNLVPLWIDNDQPPSYEEAVRMNSTQNVNVTQPTAVPEQEASSEIVLAGNTVNTIPTPTLPIVNEEAAEKPKSLRPFRKETSV